MDEILIKALDAIPADDYGIWTQVGMALKYEGYPFDTWNDWSQRSSKYGGSEKTRKKWDSFKCSGADIVKAGTIIEYAKQFGFDPRQQDDGVFGWDDVLDEAPDRDYKLFDPKFVGEEHLPPPPTNDVLWKDLPRYLNLLFQPDDHVGYCDKPVQKDGRWIPTNGIKSRTQAELMSKLKKGLLNASIDPPQGGAFIRFNPLDGLGESDANVTDFRYCLVEDDTDPLEMQYALLQKMKLPIVCIVHSGRKSLHAIVRVDAGADGKTFRERTNFIFQFCKKNGLKIDGNVKNASRYSRMPGVLREGRPQYIVAENLGFESYDEWRKWVDTQNDNLPKEVSLSDVFDAPPPLKEELIKGILRKEHKMLISAPSKAGKSFALMGLATAIANGSAWMGHECAEGKVLYINLEVDEASCINRLITIHKKMGFEAAHDIDVWNLRGRAVPMDKLVPLAINRYKDRGYSAIIVDPIYKVITGDENNATEMSQFCGYFDKLALELGCAVIYCHHDSKGAASKYSNIVDRSSGSGVFARDPDAILNFTQIDCSVEEGRYREQNPEACEVLTAWEMTGTLREFAPMKPIRIWFDYPAHYVDEWNFLANAKYTHTGKPGGERGVGKDQLKREDADGMLRDLFDMCFDEDEAIDQERIKEELGFTEKQIINTTAKDTDFERVTLEGGIKVVIRRGLDTCQYEGDVYSRELAKRKVWGCVQ